MNVAAETTLRLSRRIAAEPERVFDAWTRPEHMSKWACPAGASVEHVEVDLRVGGAYLIRMENAEGAVHNAFGSYREVERPRRLVYTWDWKEPDHSVGETLVTVEFHARDGGTEVVLVHEGFPAREAALAHEEGWSSCLDRFERLHEGA